MAKKIYLPPYARNQLETSDDSSVWAKPIPFRDKPERGFTSEAVLGENTLEIGIEYVLERGLYYPDRDQNLDGTVESIKIVSGLKKKKN
ncbi:hypothetical protein HYX16_01625 [Candidatus Woesearchaeota archaeon]|nr:hypothetical protein [Candidatus Woesearchaeota archaeon]